MKLSERLDAAMAADLIGPAKAVLLVLARMANDKSGKCWIERPKLAYQAGVKDRACGNAIAKLQREGWVTVYKRRHRVNDYYLNFAVLYQARDAYCNRHEVPTEPVLEPTRRKRAPNRKTGTPPRFRSDLCKSCHQHLAVLDGQCTPCINARARSRERQQRDALPSL